MYKLWGYSKHAVRILQLSDWIRIRSLKSLHFYTIRSFSQNRIPLLVQFYACKGCLGFKVKSVIQKRLFEDEVFIKNYIISLIWYTWLQRSYICLAEASGLHYLHYKSVVSNTGLLYPMRGLSVLWFWSARVSASCKGSVYPGGSSIGCRALSESDFESSELKLRWLWWKNKEKEGDNMNKWSFQGFWFKNNNHMALLEAQSQLCHNML